MARRRDRSHNPETGSIARGIEPSLLPTAPPAPLTETATSSLDALAYAGVEPKVQLTLGVPFLTDPKDDRRRYVLPTPTGLAAAMEHLMSGNAQPLAAARFKPGEGLPPYLKWLKLHYVPSGPKEDQKHDYIATLRTGLGG